MKKPIIPGLLERAAEFDIGSISLGQLAASVRGFDSGRPIFLHDDCAIDPLAPGSVAYSLPPGERLQMFGPSEQDYQSMLSAAQLENASLRGLAARVCEMFAQGQIAAVGCENSIVKELLLNDCAAANAAPLSESANHA